MKTEQGDLFEWADNRPSAEIISIDGPLADRLYAERVLRNLEKYDEKPRRWKTGSVVTLKLATG